MDRDEALKLLKGGPEGVAEWNRRQESGEKNFDLLGADLGRADLRGADLSKADCLWTIFADVDLSEVKGLESINHRAPSEIGIVTLFRSKGKIPDTFLRGCGLPETLINYLPSLIGAMDPIQFYSCFISYSSKNQDFA